MQCLTYILQYTVLTDKNERRRNWPATYQTLVGFGQLKHIFQITVTLPIRGNLQTENLILGAIHACQVKWKSGAYEQAYYEKMGQQFIIDINSVGSLVGRIDDTKGHIFILDRSTEANRAFWDPDSEE